MDQPAGRLIAAIVLDPEAAEQTLRVLNSRKSSSSSADVLRAAIAEAWWTMRERGRAPRELQPFLADGDPVMALTVRERTVLALSLRLGLADSEGAAALGTTAKAFFKELKTARRELARAAIAMALIENPSRCPATKSQQERGKVLDRQRALHIVTHAAECQVCVPYMRTVDRRIIDDYRSAPDTELTQLPRLRAEELAEIDSSRRLGWRERLPSAHTLMRWGAISAAASTALLLLGVLLTQVG